jgi:acetate kinase
MRIVVLNAGSSSLKSAFVVDGEATRRATTDWGVDASRAGDPRPTVNRALAELGVGSGTDPDAIGHRIVHGGDEFREPIVVDASIVARLRALEPLAPLHLPVAVDTLEAAVAALPGVVNVAAFDTALHATLPETAHRYPVPESWFNWGMRRYGFHGLSVEWAVGRAAELLGRPPDRLRLVVAHLGSGCSVTAVEHGRSVATSMGMTPLEGLMMGTRAGSIDPGILLRLLRDRRRDVDELADDLEHASGLVGIAGTSDVAALENAAEGGDARARLALGMFAERAAAGIAAAATALTELDAVVFTGGIGEHAARTRSAIVARLGVLGVPGVAPSHPGSDAVLSAPDARIAVLRIEAREELVIARHVERLLAGGRPPG